MPVYKAKIAIAATLTDPAESHEKEITAPNPGSAPGGARWLARQWAKDHNWQRDLDSIQDVTVEIEEVQT